MSFKTLTVAVVDDRHDDQGTIHIIVTDSESPGRAIKRRLRDGGDTVLGLTKTAPNHWTAIVAASYEETRR